jgi:hypothetical protein
MHPYWMALYSQCLKACICEVLDGKAAYMFSKLMGSLLGGCSPGFLKNVLTRSDAFNFKEILWEGGAQSPPVNFYLSVV